MSAERIEGLAVMDRWIEILHSNAWGEDREDLQEARAAVAELIEADKELDAAVIAYEAAHSFSLGDLEYVSAEDPAVIRLDAAKARRAAALARVQGEGA